MKTGDRVRVGIDRKAGTVRKLGGTVAVVELDDGGSSVVYPPNAHPCYCYEEINTAVYMAEQSYAYAVANAESIEAFMEVHAAAIRVREIAQEEMAKLHQ